MNVGQEGKLNTDADVSTYNSTHNIDKYVVSGSWLNKRMVIICLARG